MWVVYAFLAALSAALVAIFAKLGLQAMDTTIATTLRSIIMTAFLVSASVLLGKLADFSPATVTPKEWLMLTLAGVAGALSWLFYFLALRDGAASAVVAIDRLSIVFVVALAALTLGETTGWRSLFGAALMTIGAILIALPATSFTQIWQQLLGALKNAP